MVIRKRKKVLRYRGHRTHGGGAAKKRRGAGNRGGRGMAGSGKRADQKKPTILKLYGNKYFGKKGFISKNPRKVKAVNISYIEKNIDKFEKKGDSFIINLKDLGINKLLGAGYVKNKLIVTVESASKKAVEKIKKAGGDITLDGDN
jgi:large subunit ribosomal protein L15